MNIESHIFTHNIKSTDKVIRAHLKRIQKPEKKQTLNEYLERRDRRNAEGKFVKKTKDVRDV